MTIVVFVTCVLSFFNVYMLTRIDRRLNTLNDKIGQPVDNKMNKSEHKRYTYR